MHAAPRLALGTALVLLAAGACDQSEERWVTDEPGSQVTARGMYLPIPATSAQALSENATIYALDEPLPLYMHRYGGTYFAGQEDSSQNRSGVVGSGSATVDAFAGGDVVWNDLMECVTDQFARFNAIVTDVEPQSGDYIEAVIGGTSSQLGLPQGVGGVAPIDSFQCNIIPKAVVYVFSGGLPNDAQLLCQIAAQEIAHALSLDHELLCEDPMTYLSNCGPKTFQDQAAQCGEFSARSCVCNRPSQNSVQILYDKLGANDGSAPPPVVVDDSGPPTVAISSPDDGSVLPPNSTVEIVATAEDDNGLAAVELVWEHTGDAFPCPVVGMGYSCAVENGSYVWQLNVGSGERTFQVRARDVAGNVVATPARTISMGEVQDPVDPADDVAPPEASLVSPTNGAVLPANSTIEIVATATDDMDVASVELEWDYNDATFPCPTQQQAVTCTRQGSTYSWQVTVGTGERTFRVRATDTAAKVTTTGSRTISLSETPIEQPFDDDYEDNDTWDTATTLPCSSGLDLHARDDDWMMVSVAPGVEVTAQVRSLDGAPLQVTLAKGPRTIDILEEGATSGSLDLTATAATSYVGIRVTTTGASGDYRILATCTAAEDRDDGDPTTPPDDGSGDPADPADPADVDGDVEGRAVALKEGEAPSGCSSTGAGAGLPWLLGAALILLPLRRTRRVATSAR